MDEMDETERPVPMTLFESLLLVTSLQGMLKKLPKWHAFRPTVESLIEKVRAPFIAPEGTVRELIELAEEKLEEVRKHVEDNS